VGNDSNTVWFNFQTYIYIYIYIYMTFDVKSKELDISTEGNTSHSCRILPYVNHVRTGQNVCSSLDGI
jgi:hypothetical protein